MAEVEAMDFMNVESTCSWTHDEQEQCDSSQSFLPLGFQAVQDTPLPRQPSRTDSALAAPVPIHPSTYLPLPYQFPTLDSTYAATINDREVSSDWRSTFPQFVSIFPIRQKQPEAVTNVTRTRSRLLTNLRSERQRWLEDEAFPLKLVRALASDRLTYADAEHLVFEVLHFNNTLNHDPTFRNVRIYTTVEAANARVMEFWDQTYGTGMFTSSLLNFDDDILFVNLDFSLESASPYNEFQYSRQPTSPLSGGVPGNNSHWSINNHCLSLSHKSMIGEKRVYTVASNARNNNSSYLR